MKPNLLSHRISKEVLQWLPVASFDGEVVTVDSEDKIPAAVEYLSKQKFIGVDTESRPSFQRGVKYPTALLQMATEDHCFLFRVNKTGLPKGVTEIFANPKIRKIGLAFKDDISGLRRLRDFKPQNCVDLQSVVGKYGILDLGLQKIFAICFGKKISKSQQLTNWENAQLTPEQARYASTDAWATLLIYKELCETEPLPQKEAERLRRDNLRQQQEHQREVLATRQNNQNNDNSNTAPA